MPEPARRACLVAAVVALVALVALGGCAQRPPSGATRPQPPATKVAGIDDTYFGQRVGDPYRWLERTGDAEVDAWMRAQSAYSRAVLDRIPGRQALLRRMVEVENGAPARVSRVSVVAGGSVFFLRRDAGAARHQLVTRASLDAAERVVVDPVEFGPTHAIDYFIPSPDGRFVAFGVSPGGSEHATLYLREVASGRDLAGPIADALFNGSSPYRWSPDGSAVHFQTLRDQAAITDKRESFQWPRAWRLAARPGAVPELVADGLRPLGPSRTAHEHMALLAFGNSPWQFAYFEDGVRRDIRVLVRPAGTSGPDGWRSLIDHRDGIWQFEVRGGRVYGLSRNGASRFRIVSTAVAAPDWTHAEVVLPEGSGVVREIAAAQDALYAIVLDGAGDRLLRVSYDGAPVEEIALPFPGGLGFAGVNVERPGVLVALDGWTEATQFYRVAPQSRRLQQTSLQQTSLQPRGRFDRLEGVDSRIEYAVSHDGVRVPLSVVAKPLRGGPRPTAVVAYGAYGLTEEPKLRAEWVPWLERGYVMATCHVRGGGEYGEAWYEAGRKATKPNTWKDLIGCAEHLVATGVTTRAQLGIMGWSAGGIAVGRAFTERPDLFAAAAPGVGVLDAVRAETEPNGPGNVVEFGTVARPDEFRALYAMSAYHHVEAGVRYPAVILPHGVNDPRVAVWQSAKMAAALQAASPASVTLLNLDFDAGHGRGSGVAQRLATFADSAAFMLWQFGEPGFQPE